MKHRPVENDGVRIWPGLARGAARDRRRHTLSSAGGGAGAGGRAAGKARL